jgi:putative MFS transporter
VRASLVINSMVFWWLSQALDNKLHAGLTVGLITLAISLWALSGLEETHGKDLDYLEPL